MRLLSELVGALGAGALVFLVGRELGLGSRRACGAVAMVAVVIAATFAAPALRDAAADLLAQRRANAPLSAEQARLQAGTLSAVDVDFFAWVKAHLREGDTFHLVVGAAPDEDRMGGVGVREASVVQWGLFQLSPNLAVEQTGIGGHATPAEGLGGDWLVFYEANPADYPPGSLAALQSYAPGFAIARSRHAS